MNQKTKLICTGKILNISDGEATVEIKRVPLAPCASHFADFLERIGMAIVDSGERILLDRRLDAASLLFAIFVLGLFAGYLYFRFQ